MQLPKNLWKTLRRILFTKDGIWFPYKGDEVMYIFPWKRDKYLSLGFTGTGAFGDATFRTLHDMDVLWYNYEKDSKGEENA